MLSSTILDMLVIDFSVYLKGLFFLFLWVFSNAGNHI